MLNQVILVGKLLYMPKEVETINGELKSIICIEIPRINKTNEENDSESIDVLECTLSNEITKSILEYCVEGSTVGIKARLKGTISKKDIEEQSGKIEIVVEKITFINLKEKN